MSGLTINSKEMAAQSEFCTDRPLLDCIGTAAKVAGFTGGGSMILGFGAGIALFVGVAVPWILPIALLLGGFALYAASATSTGFDWDAIEERKKFGINTVNKLQRGSLDEIECFKMLKQQNITPADFCWLADHCKLDNVHNEIYKEFYEQAVNDLPSLKLDADQEQKPIPFQPYSGGGAIILQKEVILNPNRCSVL